MGPGGLVYKRHKELTLYSSLPNTHVVLLEQSVAKQSMYASTEEGLRLYQSHKRLRVWLKVN